MKRKLFAVLLVSALVLAACGGKKTEPSETESAVSENSVSDNDVSGNSVSDNDFVISVSGNADLDEMGVYPEMFDYTTVPAFVSEDLNGDEVTEDLIAGKEFTMINVWGTFCPPCIAEMPELQKLSESLPENAQLIGFICDVTYQNPEDAQNAIDICENAGVTYPNIVLDENLLKFTGQYYYVPTTFFVDSEGKVIGDPIIGADINSYVERFKELLPGWSYEG